MSAVLIVDDDLASCRTLQLHLRAQGHAAHVAHSAEEGLAAARALRPDLVVLDIRMPGRTGLQALPEFKRVCPTAPVIMITAFHEMESTIQAMQGGATDYIQKPIDIDELDAAVAKALRAHDADADSVLVVPAPGGARPGGEVMVGHSRVMKEVFKTIGLAAQSTVTVLITGESGTGKELVARAIHRAGANPSGPFVAVNCAALVDTLIESDMFGHEKGAFTGAVERHAGKFAMANNGTIFLDEVSELSPAVQAKLLRVLQEREFVPLGGRTPQKTNARVIAATNVDLRERVAQGAFREDLYYRLQVVTIHLPPLRERREDVPELVQALLVRINREVRHGTVRMHRDALRCFQAYDWPGNVRELENVLMKAVALSSSETIGCDMLPAHLCSHPGQIAKPAEPVAQRSLLEIEKAHVLRVLEATGWHRGQACEILRVSRPRLRRMIRQFGFVAPADAPPDESESHEEHSELSLEIRLPRVFG
ncbi:MAG: sigma-54-dependent Fis family transcriptional regulator [Burkholderiales bacterium]|nr:sigma-54-dependent Fis family transcriptional regulator [Burkholderiales bacterium]